MPGVQLPRDGFGAAALREPGEDAAHHCRLAGLHHIAAFFGLAVAVGRFRAFIAAVPEALSDGPFHVAGEGMGFFLGKGGEDVQKEFRAHAVRTEVLLLKDQGNPQGAQQPRDAQAVGGVAGKAGDGFRDDHVHPSRPAIRDQALQLRPGLRCGAADAGFAVDSRRGPVRVRFDVAPVMGPLVFHGAFLGWIVGGNAAIGRYGQFPPLRRRGGDGEDVCASRRSCFCS